MYNDKHGINLSTCLLKKTKIQCKIIDAVQTDRGKKSPYKPGYLPPVVATVLNVSIDFTLSPSVPSSSRLTGAGGLESATCSITIFPSNFLRFPPPGVVGDSCVLNLAAKACNTAGLTLCLRSIPLIGLPGASFNASGLCFFDELAPDRLRCWRSGDFGGRDGVSGGGDGSSSDWPAWSVEVGEAGVIGDNPLFRFVIFNP